MSSDADLLLYQMLFRTQLRRPVRRREVEPGEPLSASSERRAERHAAKLAQRRKKAKRKQARR